MSWLRIAPFVAAVVLSAPPAAGTVVVIPPLEEMTHRSDVVVHAVVREVNVLQPKPGKLITRTTLEVLDGIAGAKQGDLLTVHQVGGSKDGRVAWIAGAHHFVVGEELVFFGVRIPDDPSVDATAERPAAPLVVPYGIGFGLFQVKDGVDGRSVHELGGDVVQLVQQPDGKRTMAPVTPRSYASLDEFKALLRSIVAGQNPPAPPLKKIHGRPAPPPSLRATMPGKR